jgi:hypothetical protein
LAIDTPATLGIIGAGPAGLEAALYARFLGYDVLLFECDEVAGRLQVEAPVGLFGDNSSTLGRAAIAAQNPDQPLPLLTDSLTGAKWRERYLLPLADCDLVIDSIRKGVKVTRISKEHLEGGEVIGFDRGAYDFVLEVADASGGIEQLTVDAVIDASGCTLDGGKLSADFGYAEALDLRLDPKSGLPGVQIDYGDELPDSTKLTEAAKRLVLFEPNYYVIGSKTSPGEKLSYTAILDQIRAVFTIFGDRTSLDLYATAVTLPQ